ncbi:hypothetical protein KFK09_017367 [Dendrobium nobile]|uniref:Uncharacterized protein n=1 Tax=Dendrobium nobile TaxID=94219 RepID=A0A8T3B2S7_DENNO|nr:hypothetical protein KFK09_017367 [Dendrobium nobile]
MDIPISMKLNSFLHFSRTGMQRGIEGCMRNNRFKMPARTIIKVEEAETIGEENLA